MTRVVLGEADDGQAVDVGVGDQVVIRLDENPTTGYRWELVDLPAAVELAGDSFTLGEPVKVGSGGTRELTFICRRPGPARLQLRHWQAWEGASSVTRTVTFPLRVAGA